MLRINDLMDEARENKSFKYNESKVIKKIKRVDVL